MNELEKLEEREESIATSVTRLTDYLNYALVIPHNQKPITNKKI
jgi:hypothetical protein